MLDYREMDTATLQLVTDPSRPVDLPPAARAPMLVARQIKLPAGTHIAAHQHVRGQFLLATAGAIFVRTPGRAWLVPRDRALWLPAGVMHAIDAQGDLQMRSLYLDAASAAPLPSECVVLHLSPLLTELIRRLTSPEVTQDAEAANLMSELAVREIMRLEPCALELPMPESPDLLELCEQILRQPVRQGNEALAMPVGAGTLYRRFRAETGLSFVQWRKQACVLEAVRRLSSGQPVTHVALDLGYESPSAFATMFKRVLGVSPREYLNTR